MSEYQCYDFIALDRPLTSKEMAELRAISTRADITPTRFWNEYQWGNLKTDPAKLVERYFDAHLYFANFGSRRLMLRFPASRVDWSELRGYFSGATAWTKSGVHAILDLQSADEEPDIFERSPASLAEIAPVRTELMRSDLRVAYLAWLLGVQTGRVPDGQAEPPVPPGLSALTAAQLAMVKFLCIDEDLITAAAEASAPEDADADALRAWASKLTPRAKDDWLARAIDDPDLALGGEMRRVFRLETRTSQPRGRLAAELRAAATDVRQERERTEALAREKAKRATAAAKKRRLDALAKNVEAAWTRLETLVDRKDYEAAIELATDLRELARRDGTEARFTKPFEAMRKRQLRRRGFFDRLNRQVRQERSE